ncbi:MAG TPA: hypothetical protein VHM01_09615, partial [Alphaproteobacteria bacterium]|nr:hypothetical protein [Alphaproteobacteria bacterium]
LEGRTAFFCYGNEGANETDADGHPKVLQHKHWYVPERHEQAGEREAYGALVRQCCYSGVEVPDDLWRYVSFGIARPLRRRQAEDMMRERDGMAAFDGWIAASASFVRDKGKVPPNEFRAFAYQPPSHVAADLRLKWRDWRMRLGVPPAQSSPAHQQRAGPNDDATLQPMRSEGERLRR